MVERKLGGTISLQYPISSVEGVLKALEDKSAEMTLRVIQQSDGSLKPQSANINHIAPTNAFWNTLRELLIERPKFVAEMVGIPQLASLADFPMPKQSLKLSAILESYQKHNHSGKGTKQQASNIFNDFLEHTTAKTLADLTTEKLIAYRVHIHATVNSPSTVGAYFGRIKNIIRFAKSEGLDNQQLDSCLSLLSVLKAPKDERILQPSPINRNDFHAILKASIVLTP